MKESIGRWWGGLYIVYYVQKQRWLEDVEKTEIEEEDRYYVTLMKSRES